MIKIISIMALIILQSCSSDSSSQGIVSATVIDAAQACQNQEFIYNNEKGCDGKTYPNPINSPYVLPFPPGVKIKTGLTNCSSSFHSEQTPDRYAFDFKALEGTPFYAARAGVVAYVVEDQSSQGGGSGNWVVVNHQDNTYGIYLHSPKNGVSVNVGDLVNKGSLLGEVGRSGLAGYPHLHFIVVQDSYEWPYDPVPITFSNVLPADVILKTDTEYVGCHY